MIQYIKKREIATKLLTRYGIDITLRVRTTGVYNPETGGASITYEDTTRKGMFGEIKDGTQSLNGTLIQSTDRMLWLDAEGDIPKLKDTIILDAKEYVIESVTELTPTDVPILYSLHLRVA